ncbi:MAG: hypothetical protein IH591_15100 [Bacteroidales bacterium]|nr:hypothetical protein [Bacteroidales bacterium]
MAEETEFVSRTGEVGAETGKVYGLAGDMGNFTRFVPAGSVNNWHADSDSCSFEISPLGKVKVSITEREPFSKIKYEGVAMNSIPFRVWLQLKENGPANTRFRIVLRVELNPFYKMMVTGAINEYLGRLIDEIEAFDKWDTLSTDK